MNDGGSPPPPAPSLSTRGKPPPIPRSKPFRGSPHPPAQGCSMILGLRVVAPLLLVSALSAPLQCARKPTPDLRTEDDPAEALYTLAEKFKAQGNAAARAETLRFLVSRYPASRFA